MKWPVAPEALRLKSYVGPFSMLVFQPNCSMRAKGNDRWRKALGRLLRLLRLL